MIPSIKELDFLCLFLVVANTALCLSLVAFFAQKWEDRAMRAFSVFFAGLGCLQLSSFTQTIYDTNMSWSAGTKVRTGLLFLLLLYVILSIRPRQAT